MSQRSAGEMREGLQELDVESFVVEVSSRSEDFRIIYNAPGGAGVVHE